MSFNYRGKQYDYFDHKHNQTLNNERCVEVTLGREYMLNHKDDGILEVGAVSPCYFPCPSNHTVVDLIEQPQNVKLLSQCACETDYTDQNVLSISTIEHVKSGEPWKGQSTELVPDAAYNVLLKMVSDSKSAFITWALGVHCNLDKMFADNRELFDYTVVGRTAHRQWEEVDDSWLLDPSKHRYGAYTPGATAIVIVHKE